MDNETDWAKDIERRRTKQNSQHRNQSEKYKDTQELIISRKSSKKRQHIGQQTKWQRSIKKTQDRSKRLKQEEAGGETWSISILHRYKIIYQVSSVNFRGKWFQDINGVIRKRRSKKDRQYNTIQYNTKDQEQKDNQRCTKHHANEIQSKMNRDQKPKIVLD
jgi:hypothetical protein